jgi:hypothetical protein
VKKIIKEFDKNNPEHVRIMEEKKKKLLEEEEKKKKK